MSTRQNFSFIWSSLFFLFSGYFLGFSNSIEAQGHENINERHPFVSADQAEKNGLLVKIIFSDRMFDHPEFLISDEKELKQLQDLLSRSKKYERSDNATQKDKPKSRYQGFSISKKGKLNGFLQILSIDVYKKNIVTVLNHLVTELRFDKSQAVENFLIKLAIKRQVVSSKSVFCERVKEENGLQVEIDLFSGRVNPRFLIIKKKELKQLQKLLSASEKYESGDYISEKRTMELGYRGIVIKKIGKLNAFLEIDNVYIFKDRIEIESQKRDGSGWAKEVRFDRNRAVEDFLFKLATDRNLFDLKAPEHYKNAK